MVPPHPPRLLVVEDDHALAEMLERILSQAGYEVLLAHSAEEAMKRAPRADLAMALLDVMLPGMDGYSLCRELRHHPLTHHMPILMLTAKGDIADKIAGFEAGADDYLTKPFQPRELTYRIASLLERSRHRTPTQPPPAVKQGSVVALFSSKGGVGKTTIATNLAVSLQQREGCRVALVDADFSFGDVGVHLNLPKVRTILDLIAQLPAPDPQTLYEAMVPHPSGVRVLLGPVGPEEASQLTGEHLSQVLELLSHQYDFVLVDCQPSYDDRVLRVLARADEVLMVVTPEIGPLKNTSLFLDWAAKEGYALNKISVVLNRYNSNVGIEPDEIERSLQHEVSFRLISGGRPVVLSVNRGVPLVIEQPAHPFCAQIQRIADYCIARASEGPPPGQITRFSHRSAP